MKIEFYIEVIFKVYFRFVWEPKTKNVIVRFIAER